MARLLARARWVTSDSATGRSLLRLIGVVALVSAASAYTVVPGDTLSAIAGRFGTTVRALIDANGIADPDLIVAGQTLVIPGQGEDGAGDVHVVRPGETLSAIAARYGVSLTDLARANGISDVNRILAGARLRVPVGAGGAAGEPPPGEAPAVATTHVVRPGETLSAIAARYGVSLTDLARANGISDVNHILAGARLTVPGWRCPVDGPVRFIDDYGVRKPDGRVHEGVDLFAPRGAPVVAPVPGRAEQINGERGGLQVWLHGDDGTLYIGTHLDSFGAGGLVAAGAVIGTVGASGNAEGTSPHLHFEMHPGGKEGPVNPYPLLAAACPR